MDRLYSHLIQEHFRKNRQMLFLMGPRQVGKTTLGKETMNWASDVYYFNWDNLNDRDVILQGPNGLVRHINIAKGRASPPVIVLDEIHKFKDWKTLVKGFFDTYAHSGELRIIVTGSARLEMFNAGGDSLMGRYLRYRVHPFSVAELLNRTPHDQIVQQPSPPTEKLFYKLFEFGGFPEPFLRDEEKFCRQWRLLRHQQLFEEDIHELTHIHEIKQMELLAIQLERHVSSLTSYTTLAKHVRVSIETVRRWLSVLSGLYFCFGIKPWSQNLTRSLLKEPKYYLWDWSLVSDLGARAENFVASHLLKAIHYWTDCGMGEYELFFLRDKEKREVDFLIVKDHHPWLLVEVKYSNHKSLSEALPYFQKATQAPHALQVVFDAPYEPIDCFSYQRPMIVPMQTFLSQLV